MVRSLSLRFAATFILTAQAFSLEATLGDHLKSLMGQRRQINPQLCPQAAPGVNGTEIFEAACNQNPQNSFRNCMDRLWNYANSSITTTCQHFYSQYEDCETNEDDPDSTCALQMNLWEACGDYTLQAYAYCGCFYNLPNDVGNCANVELGIEEQAEIQSSSSITGTDTSTSYTSSPLSSTNPASNTELPSTTAIGPTFTPSFVPSGTLSSTPYLPPSSSPPFSTVATFTTRLPSAIALTTACTSGTSTFPCVTTSVLGLSNSGPLITGFVCQGGNCQNQQPGYEYCIREMHVVTVEGQP